MDPGQKPEKPWFLDAAFVVPLLIFIAYFWALSLTAGAYTYFNVPQEFISLNPTNVLAISRPVVALIAFGLLCVLWGFFFVSMMENPDYSDLSGWCVFMRLSRPPLVKVL